MSLLITWTSDAILPACNAVLVMHLASWISDVLKVADYEGLKNIALNNTELDFAVFPFGSLTSISLAKSYRSSKLWSIQMVSSLFFLAPMFATGSCQYPSCRSLPA